MKQRVIAAIHGGAGNAEKERLCPLREADCRVALAEVLKECRSALLGGLSPLDAVELAVRLLEDCDLFNAGHGSVLNADGKAEMDAALMEGTTLRAGAVAAVRRVKNPVSLARAVLEQSPHLLLVGQGAERYAEKWGVELMPESWFVTPSRVEQLERMAQTDHPAPETGSAGTVGAVVCDPVRGLAAATSTGGLVNKLPGRVGDSPLIGAGTWADNRTCAVSATGDGEFFVRAVFAHEVDAGMRLSGLSVQEAAQRALERVQALGGNGGCIALDREGRLALPFATSCMYRGWITEEGEPVTAIFAEEEDDVPLLPFGLR